MTSQEYWRIRAERTLVANEKSVLEYERDLKRAYDSTMLRIQKEIDAFYQKYAENHQMDLASARQRIQDLNLEDFRTQQEDYLKEAEKFGADPDYIEYLKELSSRAYITKLQEIQMNIRHQIEKLTAEYHDRGEMLLKEGYEDSFYRTLFDIQKQAGIGIDFTAPGARQLEKAVKTKWLGDNFSGRVWKNKNALLAQLDQLIPQDFVRGRGNREVAKDIAARLQTSYHNAARLVRTEMNHISNQATLDSYRTSGIVEEYEYLATLDNRTSDICRELDEKHFPLKQAQTGVNLPPMHPYCRSTTVPYFPEDDLSEWGDRVARDEKGRSYFVGMDVNFQDWVNNYAEAEYAKRVAKNPKKYAEMNKQVPQKKGFVETIADIRRRAVEQYGGEYPEELLKEAGKAVQEEFWRFKQADFEAYYKISDEIENSPENKRLREVDAKRKELMDKIETLQRSRSKSLSTFEKYQLLRDYQKELESFNAERTNLLKNEPLSSLFHTRYKLVQSLEINPSEAASRLTSVLSQIREIGIDDAELDKHLIAQDTSVQRAVKNSVKSAYQSYPTSWIRKSLDYSSISVFSASRGYYTPLSKGVTADLAVSGIDGSSRFETSIHELGHRFETVIPKILKAEKIFYDRRTAGEPLKWLGPGYSKSEKSRKDNFINTYIGKDYGGNSYEVVSMGFQYAYTDASRLISDKDYAQVIYGILALL